MKIILWLNWLLYVLMEITYEHRISGGIGFTFQFKLKTFEESSGVLFRLSFRSRLTFEEPSGVFISMVLSQPKLQHMDLTLSPLINEPYAKRIRLYLQFTKTKLQQKKIKKTELINAN